MQTNNALRCMKCHHGHLNVADRDQRICVLEFCRCPSRPMTAEESRQDTLEYNRRELAQRPEGCNCNYPYYFGTVRNNEWPPSHYKLPHITPSKHRAGCPHRKLKSCGTKLQIMGSVAGVAQIITVECTNRTHAYKRTHTFTGGKETNFAKITWSGERGTLTKWPLAST